MIFIRQFLPAVQPPLTRTIAQNFRLTGFLPAGGLKRKLQPKRSLNPGSYTLAVNISGSVLLLYAVNIFGNVLQLHAIVLQ